MSPGGLATPGDPDPRTGQPSPLMKLGDQNRSTTFQATFMTVHQGVKIAPLKGTSPSHMLNWHVFVGQALQHAAWVVNRSPIHEFTKTPPGEEADTVSAAMVDTVMTSATKCISTTAKISALLVQKL